MRKTSIESYQELVDSGRLKGVQAEIVRVLAEQGVAMSAGEVASRLRSYQLDSVRPRFAELAKAGIVREAGERKCKVTGKQVIVWEFANGVEPVIKTQEELQEILEIWRQCPMGD